MEAENELQPFLSRGGRSIVIYGADLKYFDALKKWLDSSSQHQLVFLEDKSFTFTFSHPQVSFAVLGDDNKKTFAKLTNDFYFLPLASHKNNVEKVYPQLLQEVYAVHAYLSDLWLFEEQANFYHHLSCLNEYCPSIGMQASLPFVICGAGPSLEEHLEELSSKDFSILLPVGTAMNILNDAGIDGDLGVAFDGKRSGARRLQSNSAFTTPFFVDLDSSGRYIHGLKFLTKQPNLPAWKNRLLDTLGINHQLMEIGPSITSTHYAILLGLALKASSITLVGVDLAYLHGLQYAGKKTWLLDEDPLKPLVKRKDLLQIAGKDHQTSRTFYQEALIYSQIVSNHAEVKFYDGNLPKGEKWQIDEMPFYIPLAKIKDALLKWKDEIIKSPEALLDSYRKRFALLDENQDKIESFCSRVVSFHIKAIEEALLELEDKMPPKAEIPYTFGKLDGLVRLFYDNGQVKSEIDYKDGHRNGVYRFYARSGMLLEEGNYRMGVPHGLYQQWNRKGYLEKKMISHPNEVFDLTEWNEKGEVIREIKSGLHFSDEAKNITASIRIDLEQDF